MAKLFVFKLKQAEIATLEEMRTRHPNARTRNRAHAVLLSNQGRHLNDIADIFGVHRNAAALWLNNWNRFGLCGIMERPRSGRPPSLGDVLHSVREIVAETPSSLRTALATLSGMLGVNPCLETLRRCCREAGMVWKRVRKALKSRRDPEAFSKASAWLADLVAQAGRDEIDLFFLDESGFSLTPCVPYAWQERGKTLEVPSSRSQSLNVVGLMDSHGKRLHPVVFEGSVTAEAVVACLDDFAQTVSRRTVVIMDNAPTHTSLVFENAIPGWEARGIEVRRIPPYSPELNRIEILWRKIKYEWMPLSAYASLDSLREALFDILSSFGSSRSIHFSNGFNA